MPKSRDRSVARGSCLRFLFACCSVSPLPRPPKATTGALSARGTSDASTICVARSGFKDCTIRARHTRLYDVPAAGRGTSVPCGLPRRRPVTGSSSSSSVVFCFFGGGATSWKARTSAPWVRCNSKAFVGPAFGLNLSWPSSSITPRSSPGCALAHCSSSAFGTLRSQRRPGWLLKGGSSAIAASSRWGSLCLSWVGARVARAGWTAAA
mmetsp:Transcript_17568/g.50164  ORF Transcript_17568/g.50164 Transcript_17568/m.50164 type:complete len:209 (-) Transcript_17568:127-753(-)